MAEVYQQNGGLKRMVESHSDGSFTLATEQDLEDVIAENKMLAENQTGKETYRLAARVPVDVVERAMREGWLHDDDKWRKWMNDADNRDHRVWAGRI